jgi:hypothetical protein
MEPESGSQEGLVNRRYLRRQLEIFRAASASKWRDFDDEDGARMKKMRAA